MAPSGYYPSHHADFVQHLAQKRAEEKKRPDRLTAAQHTTLREELARASFLLPAYADPTKINIAGILRKWKAFCGHNCEDEQFRGSWKDVMARAARVMAMDFLYYLCDNYRIRSEGTSWEYFRQFKQLFSCVNGRYMDTNDCKEILKFHDTVLVPLFDLQPPNVNGKPVLGCDGLFALLVFNIAYDTGIVPVGRQRVNLSGVYLFLGYTGGRPAEFVDNEKRPPRDGCMEEVFGPALMAVFSKDDEDDEAQDEHSLLLAGMLSRATRDRGRPKALCYEDILLAVVRDPDTGRDVFVMAVRLVHHKGADRKPKPTIFFFFTTSMLIFCPITVIVSLAVCDKAFAAPSLTGARCVFAVRNHGPVQCTPLRWKKEWLKRPVFRRSDGEATSPDEAMLYHTLRDDMERQSLDAGMEEPIRPRAFRRWTANEVNGKAPDAVRDQVMRHDPRWTTFYSAYINEIVEFDTQACVLGTREQNALIKTLSHMSLTRDPRAARDMVPDEVWSQIERDPEIVELERERARRKGGEYRIAGRPDEAELRKLTQQINNKRAKFTKKVQKEYRGFYFENRPTWDIEMQASGEAEEAYIAPVVDHDIPERARLAKLLCQQPEGLSEEEIGELRVVAADDMTALCDKRETARRNHIRRAAPADVAVKDESPAPDPDPFPLAMDRQCPDCLGDERLPLAQRTFKFSRNAVVNDHFEDQHLQAKERAEQHGELISCRHPACKAAKVKLPTVDLFRIHVQSVHTLTLRTGAQAKQRRERKAKFRRARGPHSVQ